MNNFSLVNLDTDSISFSKKDGASFSEEEQANLLISLNSLFPEKIKWEHDGIYESLIVLKAKNYITLQDGKIKKKGSSLKSSKTEKGLIKFMDEVISALLFQDETHLLPIYNKYIKLVNNLTDINDFTSKKTVTKSVLSPTRSTEQKILDAIGTKNVSMGDKVYVYFTKPDAEGTSQLKLAENWSNDHDPVQLMSRIYKTLTIFANVVKMDMFPKYHLKNKKIKEELDKLLNEAG